ncbi:MAG: hypothetical protein HY655_15285, partial [Acidobacteria bacterium]|nr:hypothetical protein [Acidobacteriota bacterium]
IRPEIARIVAIEERTANLYGAAVGRFTSGRISVERLIDTIDRAVTPELQAATARIRTLDGVAPEHEPLVESAAE